MDVSIIIVNYKTADLIANAITSIIRLTKDISYEIIVVDNNSNDNCYNLLKDTFKNDIELSFISLKENKGFGMANNEGVYIAKGRNILFLNPDTLLINNAIKELSNYLDNHNDVGACGGNLYDELMKPAQSFYRILPSLKWDLSILTFRKIEKLIFGGNYIFNYTDHPIKVGYITGADLMVKKKILDEFGGFSSDFFMYYEETDLCCRIKKHGYKIINVPTAKIQHLEGKSFDREQSILNIERIKMSEESRLIYYKRNVGHVEIRIANITYSFALSLNKFIFRLLKRNIWKKYKYQKIFYKELRKSILS